MPAISYSYVIAKFLIILWTSGIPARVPLASKYCKRIDSLDGAIMKAAMVTASVAITKDRGTRTMMKHLKRSDL